MISVMSEREMDTKPPSSSSSAAAVDVSFLGGDPPREEARVSESLYIGRQSSDPEADGISSLRDRGDQPADSRATVSENGGQRRSDASIGAAVEMDSDSDSRGEGSSVSEDGASETSSEFVRASPSPRWMNGFEIGDMVWGKVKSHPWWPGHIYNEAFASSSVRRTRRDGHVLVAFFGDSSYGWFDPRELIPFDPNYQEKSRQTTARAFVKAVEESADEAGRRGALALTCRCRGTRRNFRPTAIPGYLAVNVPGYEPGGIYSLDQIGKLRGKFVPLDMLSFVRQLAAALPREGEARGVHWIRTMAMLLAYRRAVFEEFDETYAQAFGVEPVRPSQEDAEEKFAPRATPLSGPLVIAEALGGQPPGATVKQTHHTVPKAAKVPSAKKNKYLLKRREEAPATTLPRLSLPDLQRPHGAGSSYSAGKQQSAEYFPQRPAAPSDGSASSSRAEDYVLQKRVPATTPAETKLDEVKFGSLSSPRAIGSHAAQWPSLKSEPGLSDVVGTERLDVNAEPKSAGVDANKTAVQLESVVATVAAANISRQDGKLDVNVQGAFDGAAPKQELPTRFHEPLPMAVMPSTGKALETKAVDGVVKKMKPPKRKHEDSVADNDAGDLKKKKKKKMRDLGAEPGQGHVPKISKDRQPLKKPAVKPILLGSGQAERPRAELQRRDGNEGGQGSSFPVPAAPLPTLDWASLNLQVPELVDDLWALALDPFFASERNAPSIIRQAFLKFRSLVYQKSLVLPPASEPETAEFRASKLAAGRSLQGPSITSESREPSSSSKPLKRPLKSDDPSVAGRKRGPSDRQEELSAKRVKKLEKVKALAAEKKASVAPKMAEGQQRDQKDAAAIQTAKLNKAEPVKKLEPPPPKVPSPTWVVMKFPPRTTLPSVASLKARFARFGPLDLDGTRVYWKSHSCKVLFKYRVDALSAYSYVKSNDLFGQIKVNYSIREVEAPAQEPAEPQKPQPELRPNDVLQFRPGNGTNNSMSQPRPPLYQQLQRQQSVQLKSCLKKPSDEVGVAKESPRVKFMLGGDDRKEPPMAGTTSNTGGGNGSADGPSFSSPFLDTPISKNLKSVSFLPPQPSSLPRPSLPNPPPMNLSRPFDMQRLPPPPPLLPIPRGLDAIPIHRPPQVTEVQPSPRYDQTEGRGQSGVDISGQLVSLLIRCNDIVMNVKSALGYVPYHPL